MFYADTAWNLRNINNCNVFKAKQKSTKPRIKRNKLKGLYC